MNIWEGSVSTDASNGANWSLDHYPRVGEDVVFDGTISSANCVDLGNPAVIVEEEEGGGAGGMSDENAFQSISLINGYAGHVSLDNGFIIDTLILSSGSLDQPVSYTSTEIVIREEFTWTGGTLNSTSNLSSINFRPGSVSSISPGEGNTLSLGSSLFLLDPISGTTGSTLTFNPGNVNFINGGGGNVGAYSQVFIDTKAADIDITKPNTKGGQWTIESGGKFKIFGGGEYGDQIPMLNNGGTIEIVPGEFFDTTARFTGTFGNNTLEPNIRMAAGQLILSRCTHLRALDGIVLEGGTLSTKFLDRAKTDPNLWAKIYTDKLINNGANISFYADLNSRKVGNVLVFDGLMVDGDVLWTTGDYLPYMEAGTADNRDLWISTGTFTITPATEGPAGIAPTVIDAQGQAVYTDGGAALHWGWVVLQSDTSLVLDQNNLPRLFSSWIEVNWSAYDIAKKKLFLQSYM